MPAFGNLVMECHRHTNIDGPENREFSGRVATGHVAGQLLRHIAVSQNLAPRQLTLTRRSKPVANADAAPFE